MTAYEFKLLVIEHCKGCRHYKPLHNHKEGDRFCDYIGDTGHARGGTVFECDRNTGKRKTEEKQK